MGRYRIRNAVTKHDILCTNEFNLKSIKEDIALLHYYDTKEPKQINKYEVFDTKTKQIRYTEL